MRQFVKALQYARGDFVPFLKAYWGEEERHLLYSLSGNVREDLRPTLIAEIEKQFGEKGSRVFLSNSGRSAIFRILRAANLPSNSEVALPSHSCIGVVQPILQAGHQPVFVDVDSNFNMCAESLKSAWSPKLRAVILPHLSGIWADDFDSISLWCQTKQILLIEDTTQALGLVRSGRYAGNFGDASVFSTGSGKPIFGPGGGWVMTKNPELVRNLEAQTISEEPQESAYARALSFAKAYDGTLPSRGRKIVWMAMARKKRVQVPSYDFSVYQMSVLDAALTLIQIPKLRKIIEGRRANAKRWLSLLNFQNVQMPPLENNIFCKFLLSASTDGGRGELSRFLSILARYRVEAEPSYQPLHTRTGFTNFRRVNLDTTDRQWLGAYCLPARPNLTDEEWQRFRRASMDFI